MTSTLTVADQYVSGRCALYNSDAIPAMAGLPDASIGLSVFSPPFSSLYIYSDSDADMGNSEDDEEFFAHFNYLIPELWRITKPGRLCVVHCSDLPRFKFRDGVVGLKDFPGMIIAAFERFGWVYTSRVTIWKDPVVEMQRTKSIRLLYKQLRKDATQSGQGIADYLVCFRKVTDEPFEPVTHTYEEFPLDQWQQWASPVWSPDSDRFSLEPAGVWRDIDQGDVLNVKIARTEKEERHLCPLQLPVIERVIRMWSNPGDVIFSPFAGIGSEPYTALRFGRRACGIELKPEYFKFAVRHCIEAEKQQEQVVLDFGSAVDEHADWCNSVQPIHQDGPCNCKGSAVEVEG